MKKTLGLVMAGALVFVLAGCESKKSTDQNNIPNAIGEPGGSTSGTADKKKNMQENANANDPNKKENQSSQKPAEGSGMPDPSLAQEYYAAIIKTNQGDIKVQFNQEDAPLAVSNFLKLSLDHFYDSTKFHRVIKGFMIQGGDPLSKDDSKKDRWGTGGPGYQFKDELKGTEKYPQGTLAMANAGPDTNGSQFFIVTASPDYPLPPNYTVFGKVIEGMEVALKIENVKTDANDRPVDDVVINSVQVLEK